MAKRYPQFLDSVKARSSHDLGPRGLIAAVEIVSSAVRLS